MVHYRVMLLSAVLLRFFPSLGQCQEANSLERFVLSDSDVPGFTIIHGPSYYGPETLWNYINGGALPYFDYSVGNVVTFTGLSASDSLEIVVDVYDMADSLGAFGIYSNERFPEYSYLDIGAGGYHTGNLFCFWKDRYYVKVFSTEDSPSALKPVELVARTMEKRIPEGGGMAWYFSLFPDLDKQERTESFIASNVLGQDYLKNAFSVTYLRGEEEFQLYLIEAPDAEVAEQSFQKYCEFIREYGKLDDKHPSIGDEAFTGKEDWYGNVLFTRMGRYILGSVGLSDLELARTHLEAMIKGLSR